MRSSPRSTIRPDRSLGRCGSGSAPGRGEADPAPCRLPRSRELARRVQSLRLPSTAAPVVCAGLVVADHVCPPLDHLPRAGELIAVDDLVLNIGGGAANTAVDLARLGVTAAICARVGDDIFGRFATETLRGHGVDVPA